ncbi:MAG: CotH kinase family protein [Oscillospiraceae bacterium]|nr:CotH kinase family protein [Oscillospiraceae bacterium]MBP1571605.1 CotH kinase family protein [Oscillospiraceae bacterium]
MIAERKAIHKIGVIITLILFFIAAVCCFTVEKNTVLGVRIISKEKYEKMVLDDADEFNIRILFNETPAAIDITTETVYISQSIDAETRYSDLKGVLSVDNANYQLMFVDDSGFEDIYHSISDGYNYTLIAVNPEGKYKKYNVVFTTLPVFNINGEPTGEYNLWREIIKGRIHFFDPHSKETGSYRTLTTDAYWHRRGNTTDELPKLSWKVTLQKSSGENDNLSFCGLGEDDDWILNAMALDDLKIREKVAMELWNQNEVFTDCNAVMSNGKYTEVVLNGEYKGTFLLQRRIDGRYLGLDEDNILLKGNFYYPQEITSDYFEIKHSPYSEPETRAFLDNNFITDITADINMDNFIDTNLYINMMCAIDNRGEKNIFRLFNNIDEELDINYILWDTDMCFGIIWKEVIGFCYDYDTTIYHIQYRNEFAQVLQSNPKLEKMVAERWFELRQTLFSNEKIEETINNSYKTITESNSLQRDHAKWGLYYNGKDTMDNLYLFIDTRLEYLDKYYASFL